MSSRFVRSKKPPGLMLTSLIDMFTLILIFLIMSFDAEGQEFELNDKVELPQSSARSALKPAVNVALTPTGIILEKKNFMSLKDGRAQEEIYAQGYIPVLVDELKPIFEEIQAGERDGALEAGEEGDPAVILVQAHKEIDYQTIYLVLKSASIAGFVKYRLAIIKK